MWQNYPQHKLEHIRIPPTFDKEPIPKIVDFEKEYKKVNKKDLINTVFKDHADGLEI